MTIWITKCDHGLREFDSLDDAKQFQKAMTEEKLCYFVDIYECNQVKNAEIHPFLIELGKLSHKK